MIEDRIAQTAMSTVYRARSAHLGRDFCAKFVPKARLARRWQREVEVLSHLHNPHIVKLFRTVELDSEVVLILDWVPGMNLGRYVAENGPLPPSEALEITRQLALGLADIHELGIVHRDLKPANVMVDRLPSGDLFVCLLDLGISKAVADPHVSTGFVGSPLYAAPEQIAERAVDRRTDLYQLGCLLHYMLTGAPPFNAADAPTVMNAHLYQPPSRVSSAIPRLRRWGLDDLVLDLLAKTPEERPQSAEEVLDRLSSANHQHAGETHATPSSATLSVVGPDQSVVTADENHIVVRREQVESHFDIPGVTVTALHAGPGVVYFGTRAGAICKLVVRTAMLEEILQLPRMRPITTVATTGRRLIAADEDGRIFVIHPEDKSYEVVRATTSNPPLTISGAERTEHFAVVDADGHLTIFEDARATVTADLGIQVRHLAMSPDGYVLAAFGDGQTLVINTLDGTVMHRVALKRKLDAMTFVGGTLIGIGQTHNGTETFDLLDHDHADF